jgi:hypothetical protein
MKPVIVTVLFLLTAVPASACGDGAVAQNLRLTAGVRAGLADAYRAAHRQAPARPLAGHTWYGRFGDFEYAVATFDGRQAVYTRHHSRTWLLALETRGSVCAAVVPAELLHGIWWWPRAHGACYSEPEPQV